MRTLNSSQLRELGGSKSVFSVSISNYIVFHFYKVLKIIVIGILKCRLFQEPIQNKRTKREGEGGRIIKFRISSFILCNFHEKQREL